MDNFSANVLRTTLESNGHYVPSEFHGNENNNEFFSFQFGDEQIWDSCEGDECTYDMAGEMFTHLFSNLETNSVS